MEAGNQAKQPNPHQHMHPVRVFANDHFHRLWQRIVNVGQFAPVTCAARHQHYANCQHHQRQDPADIGTGNGPGGIFRLFSRHRGAFNGKEKPDGEGDSGENPGEGGQAEAVAACPAVCGEVRQAEAR